MSTLNGTASNTSWNIFIQSTVAIPLYVLFILLPSLFLNGSIVLAFFQEVCTHTTQPPHCQSVLCGYLQQSSEWILATNCHSSCSQAWELCHYSTSNSISQLDTLWNEHAQPRSHLSWYVYHTEIWCFMHHVQKALSVILINWIYPAFWGAIIAFITRDYPNLTCEAYTDYQRPSPNTTAGPQIHQICGKRHTGW